MARNIPSLKTLRDHFGRYVDHEYGDGAAAKLRELRRGLEQWRDGTGVRSYEVLNVANEVLGGHGLESLENEDGETMASYVNMGDVYASTLIYDPQRVRFWATDWGSFVEAEERRGVKFR